VQDSGLRVEASARNVRAREAYFTKPEGVRVSCISGACFQVPGLGTVVGV